MDSKLGDKSSENAKLRTMAEEREESIAEMDMEIKDLRERYQI